MMMKNAKFSAIAAMLALVAVVFVVSTKAKEGVAPIKVLLITGGGWHDYESQEKILRETITSRLNATVDVKWTSTDEHPVEPKSDKIPHIFTTDFAKGYDVVFHNHCHVGFQDDAAIDAVVDKHAAAKVGVVMTHGSFHTFMRTPKQAWDRLCGCNSIKHVHKSPIDVKIMTKDHPVTKALGVDGWQTKEGELYTTTLNEGTINLAEGTTLKGNTKTDSCIFTHTLDGSPVVGITLGHHNSTMEQAEYKDLVTYSVLYAAGKLDKDGAAAEGYLNAVKK